MHKRRLAAIIFTDIVGYTKMMQENELKAASIRKRHRSVFEESHQRYNGKPIQYYGDGTLSIFDSAIEAVRCAISMQQQFQQDPKVPLRVGIHTGDIVFTDTEVYGDGVNLTSRIEALGIAGNILLTDKVVSELTNHSDIQVRSLGFFHFKNIQSPVEVYAVANPGIIIPDRTQLKGKTADKKKSIAVLPFVNLSSDPENEYFSDGISEEILNALVPVDGLRVTARTSSFAFKNKNLDVREIGRQLGVFYVLEGSVRKSGEQVRITAQLISTLDGFHLFSENYNRKLDDIFGIQEEIAQAIVNRLRQHLSESEHKKPLVKAPTQNLDAYQEYLKGLYYINQWGDQSSEHAKPYFEKALQLEPGFSQAHCMLAFVHLFAAFGGKMSWSVAYREGMQHLQLAQSNDPDTVDALLILNAFQTFAEWDWQAMKSTCEKMFQLYPGEARIYHNLATYHAISGDIEKCIALEHRGLKLDPMSVQLNFYMGFFHTLKREHEKANTFYDRVLALVPNHRPTLEMKGLDLILRGDCPRARTYFRKISPFGYRLHQSTLLGLSYAYEKKTEPAHDYLRTLYQLMDTTEGFAGHQDLLILHAALGEVDQAFYHLNKALELKIGDSMLFHIDPYLEVLQPDPRFTALKKKIGIDQIAPLNIPAEILEGATI